MLAGIIKKVKDKLEALGAFVIGVGDMVEAGGESAHERGHRDDFGFVSGARREGAEIALVGGVHGDYEVEIVEVGATHLTAAVGEFVAAALCVDAHAAVGEFADMVVARSGRVDNPVGVAAAAVGNGPHHALRRGAAADIAEAHKKYFDFLFVFQRVNKFYCFMVYVVVYHFSIFLMRSYTSIITAKIQNFIRTLDIDD